MPQILVLNAGSSSMKFSVFEDGSGELRAHVRGQLEGLAGQGEPRFVARRPGGSLLVDRKWGPRACLSHEGALNEILAVTRDITGEHALSAAVHRVVHGGETFTGPVRVDDAVLARLQGLVPLAPLHQPHSVRAIRLLRELEPALPQIACFDTAFHRTQPDVAQRFALPEELYRAGVRRYGFHGLSYEHVASTLASLDERAARGRAIVLHLGNGASMCALCESRSVATTMSFSALDGLCMGTRCGELDPGVVLWLSTQRGMDPHEIERLLYERSGLLGVSGISADMRTLLSSSDPRAALAVDLFVYRAGRELGSLAAALGGVDAIVFTGGIGENAAAIRARVCADAAWLGVVLDPAANAAGGTRISAAGSRTSAWVIPADEEVVMARHARRVLTRTEVTKRADAATTSPTRSSTGKRTGSPSARQGVEPRGVPQAHHLRGQPR